MAVDADVGSLTDDDVLETGKYRFRFQRSPHLPHGWDAGLLFEETRKTLFCSDLFHQFVRTYLLAKFLG